MNKKGFSLVELALGIAVIAILILGIVASAGIRDNARVHAAANSIQTLRSAAEGYLSSGNLNYANLNFTALQTANLLPAAFNPASSNPFGGSFSIGPDPADNTHFLISLSSLNQTHANRLTSFFNNSASSTNYNASQSTWTVIF